LIYNLGIILGGLLLAPRMGVEGFAWVRVGRRFGGQLSSSTYRCRRRAALRSRLRLAPPDLKRYILSDPAVDAGLDHDLFHRIFSKLFGSFLPEGAIAHIDFAWRIMLMLVAFFGQAVGVAAYPFLARLAAEKHLADMNRC
jgi:putative peptidoglycan lipid II flippase